VGSGGAALEHLGQYRAYTWSEHPIPALLPVACALEEHGETRGGVKRTGRDAERWIGSVVVSLWGIHLEDVRVKEGW